MWLARYFPGLQLGLDDVDAMTPETTSSLRKVGDMLLKREFEERWAHTKSIVRAASSGVRL